MLKSVYLIPVWHVYRVMGKAEISKLRILWDQWPSRNLLPLHTGHLPCLWFGHVSDLRTKTLIKDKDWFKDVSVVNNKSHSLWNTHKSRSFKQWLLSAACIECLLAKLNVTLFTYSRILRTVYKKRILNNCMGIRVNSNSSYLNDGTEKCAWTQSTKCDSGRRWGGTEIITPSSRSAMRLHDLLQFTQRQANTQKSLQIISCEIMNI